MNDISYTKTIKKLYEEDITNLSDIMQSIEKNIDEIKYKTKEERGKAFLLRVRDIIMKIYVK